MTTRRSSLTGSWSGAYRFPGDARPEVVFNAQIEERGGAFTGAHAFDVGGDHAPGRKAVDVGLLQRAGQEVVFTKFYDGSGGMAHAVRYQGTADASLMRIDGTWSIPGDWSGTFFMVRDDESEAAAAEDAAEAAL